MSLTQAWTVGKKYDATSNNKFDGSFDSNIIIKDMLDAKINIEIRRCGMIDNETTLHLRPNEVGVKACITGDM